MGVQIAFATLLFSITAGTGYMFIAFLTLPAPVILWVKGVLVTLINKTGVGAALTKLHSMLVPAALTHRVYLFFKWKVGRSRIALSYRIHALLTKR